MFWRRQGNSQRSHFIFIDDFEIWSDIFQLIDRLQKMFSMQIWVFTLKFGARILRIFSLFRLWYFRHQAAQALLALVISFHSIFLEVHQVLLSRLLLGINSLDLQVPGINSIKVRHLLVLLIIEGLAWYIEEWIWLLGLQALVAWLISVIHTLGWALRWFDCLVQDLVFGWKYLLRIALLLVDV